MPSGDVSQSLPSSWRGGWVHISGNSLHSVGCPVPKLLSLSKTTVCFSTKLGATTQHAFSISCGSGMQKQLSWGIGAQGLWWDCGPGCSHLGREEPSPGPWLDCGYPVGLPARLLGGQLAAPRASVTQQMEKSLVLLWPCLSSDITASARVQEEDPRVWVPGGGATGPAWGPLHLPLQIHAAGQPPREPCTSRWHRPLVGREVWLPCALSKSSNLPLLQYSSLQKNSPFSPLTSQTSQPRPTPAF